MYPVNRNPSPKDLRQFGLAMLGGFAALAVVFWVLGRSDEAGWGWSGSRAHAAAVVFLMAGPALALISFAAPRLGRAVYVAWMTVGIVLGTVMSTVLLSILFFVLLPVFSLIRIKDPLRLKLRASGTYWEDHKPQEATLERATRLF